MVERTKYNIDDGKWPEHHLRGDGLGENRAGVKIGEENVAETSVDIRGIF